MKNKPKFPTPNLYCVVLVFYKNLMKTTNKIINAGFTKHTYEVLLQFHIGLYLPMLYKMLLKKCFH